MKPTLLIFLIVIDLLCYVAAGVVFLNVENKAMALVPILLGVAISSMIVVLYKVADKREEELEEDEMSEREIDEK